MPRSLVVLSLLAAAACDNPISYSGYQMTQYFPFDGERTWEYKNAETGVPYKIVGTLERNVDTSADGSDMHRIAYERACLTDTESCTDGWIRDVLWSVDGQNGARIWGYEDEAGAVDFDPPVVVAESQMQAGESVSVDTGGTTWTSSFEGVEECPVTWTQEWGNSCLRMHVDDGDGDPAAGSPIAGDYWVITQYNVVGMQLTDHEAVWELSYATYERE